MFIKNVRGKRKIQGVKTEPQNCNKQRYVCELKRNISRKW